MALIERNEIALKDIKTVVLDETDKLLGLEFIEEIEEVFENIHKSRKQTQVCLISWKIENWVEELANKIMINKTDDNLNSKKEAKPVLIEFKETIKKAVDQKEAPEEQKLTTDTRSFFKYYLFSLFLATGTAFAFSYYYFYRRMKKQN